MAKKRAAGARGQHEVVVVVSLAVENDLLAFRIHLGHLPQEHLYVALHTNQFPQRSCHISAGHQASGDLIQQRLEQVEIAFVNQRDPNIRILQRLAGVNACKATTDDHNVRGSAQPLFRRLKLEKVMIAGHGATEFCCWTKAMDPDQICPCSLRQTLQINLKASRNNP